MAQRTYKEKKETVKAWVEIINYHWDRLYGVLNNDKDFWADTLHAMQDCDWWDCVDVADVLTRQYPEHFRPFSNFSQDLQEVTKRLHQGKAVVKPMRVSYNLAAFRMLMTLKDVVNEIRGTPTKRFTKRQQQLQQEIDEPTQFERLFNE